MSYRQQPSGLSEELEGVLNRLAQLDRAPGSAGEARAALILAEEFERHGARSRIEPERVHGTYWVPIGLACAVATLAGAAPRLRSAALALLAAGSIADDLEVGARPLRRILWQRTAHNVVAEIEPDAADGRTVVVHAHHDAARTGIVFHPAGAKLLTRLAGGVMERVGSTPAPMWGAVAGPALVAIGSLLGSRRVRGTGVALSGGYAAAMANIACSPAVPGANDNLSSVCALLALARALAERPPQRVRVLLLSTGSEESFLEAMVRFGKRHFSKLDPDRTTFLCLESIGSPELMLLDGEGLLRLRRYPPGLIGELTALAVRSEIELRDPFRYRLATDGQIPLRAGYPTAVISSMDWYRAPSNYHWPTDRPENLDRKRVGDATRLAEAFIRRRDEASPGAPSSPVAPADRARDSPRA